MMNVKRQNRKVLSFVLTLALVIGMFAGMTVTASAASYTMTDVNTNGTNLQSGDVVSINSTTEMGYFNAYVSNAAKNTSAVTFNLTADITLSGTWAPAGIATISSNSLTYSPEVTAGAGFAGTFNGNNHTISGLSVSTSDSGAGLFKYLAPTGTIQNVTVSGIVVSTGSDAAGGIVGYNSGVINNVTSNITVSAVNTYNVGGIAGFNDSLYTDDGIGGIVNSINSGYVTGRSKIGGIAGENAGTINSCANTGDIYDPGSGKNGTGGIAGRNGNNNTAFEVGVIENCYNTGFVSSYDGRWVGGITGFQNALSSVTNCYSIGDIDGYNNYNNIVGNNEGTTSFAYTDDPSRGTGTDPGETGTDPGVNMQSTAFATLLNTNVSASPAIWDQDDLVNNAYPYLTNVVVPPTTGTGGELPGPETVYLDVTAATNGDGTEEDPFNNLDDAVSAAGADGSVSVMATVTLAATTRNDIVTFERYEGFSGPLFDIANGQVTLTTMTIDGNGTGTLINVSSGGALRLRGSLVLTDCGTAVDVQAGGSAEFGRAAIDATGYSIYMEDADSTFIMNDFGYEDAGITGTVYMSTGAAITAWANLNFVLTVECADPDDERVVVIADNVDLSADSNYLQYVDDEWFFDGDEDAIWLAE